MREIRIVSRKYDRKLRSEYTAFLYSEIPEILTVYTPPGTMDFDARKGIWLEAPDGLLELYFRTRWYTVYHICEQNSFYNTMYVHISMPAVLTAHILEWVDLDLDYRVHLDGSIELLDEDEFEYNSQTLEYPAHIVTSAKAACSEIEHLYRQNAFPFNHREQIALYQRIKQECSA